MVMKKYYCKHFLSGYTLTFNGSFDGLVCWTRDGLPFCINYKFITFYYFPSKELTL